MSFAELIRTVIPIDDDPGTLRRWRIMIGVVVLLLVLHAVWGYSLGYALRAESDERMDRLDTKIDRLDRKVDGVSSQVDRGTELQLIQLTRSLYEQKCRAESNRDKSDLQTMIDIYEQRYSILTGRPMPSPAVRC